MFAAVQPDAARRPIQLPRFFTAAAQLGERYGELGRAKEELGPGPCRHLFILGVEPAQQGRGRGSELIAPQPARADAGGQRTYLETSEERNLPFYERHGFRCPGRRDPAGLPPFWPMIREPR